MLKQLSDLVRKHPPAEEADTLPFLDTKVKRIVRIINGSLDEEPDSPGGIILNGRIDPATLHFLKVDGTYQRPLAERADIFMALKNGVVVPNIDIGVRGQDFSTDGADFLIHSDAYIIDGWQRVGNARRLLELIPDFPLRIFATVHFGTDELWERHRFTELNKNVKKVSPNLHLRNMRDSNEAVLTLFGLCENTSSFSLYKKVCWSQNMARGQLMSASLLTLTAALLHAHQAGIPSNSVEKMAASVLNASRKITLGNFRKNVTTFFDVLDECWPFSAIEYRHRAPQIRTTFLVVAAKMFSSHKDFWDTTERTFFVSADMRRKLAKFPLSDPHVFNLTGAGGAARNILSDLLVGHMNSGRRTGHLRARHTRDAK